MLRYITVSHALGQISRFAFPVYTSATVQFASIVLMNVEVVEYITFIKS
jgi:hypothetical protein